MICEKCEGYDTAFGCGLFKCNNILSKRLAAYEDAEENGLLIRLPCKVGDMLYEIDLPEYGVIVCKVLYVDFYCGPFAHAPGGKIVSATSVGVEVVEGHGKGSSYAFEKDDFGKTVFLTRAEAEAALKGESKDV